MNQENYKLTAMVYEGTFRGTYKTWTNGPWTPSVDRVQGQGPS